MGLQTGVLIKTIIPISASTSMLDGYDPNSIRLFSKCARNQASKFTHKRRGSSQQQQQRPYSSLIACREGASRRKQLSTFDMYESRQQRERKYRPPSTPPVGQYNPRSDDKVKLTWDILKVYHKRTEGRKKSEQSRAAQAQPGVEAEDPNGKQIATETTEPLVIEASRTQTETMTDNYSASLNSPNKSGKYHNQTRRRQNKRYQTVKSQVDMSRMTGRQGERIHSGKSHEYSEPAQYMDPAKSLQYVKSRTCQNFDFDKQLSREKVNSLVKPIVVPSDYSYNYNVIKPKRAALFDFNRTIGRSGEQKKSLAYSYTHYDYDKYAWEKKSGIFSNTKTHLVEFKKQSMRPIFKK